MDTATIAPALEEARHLVRADGGDMELVSADAATGTVKLKLVLEGASCAECVMPKMFLEQIVLDMLTRAGTGVAAVDIEDPREDPDWVAPEH